MHPHLFALSALVALIPATLVAFRQEPRRDGLFWSALAVATAGPLAWATAQMVGAWHTDLPATLWVIVAACAALFALLSAMSRGAWRLMPLLMPYLLALGLLAALLHEPPALLDAAAVPTVWIDLHIGVSVATYGLLTLAAIAGLAAFLQEGALKRKRPTPLTRALPPLAESEALQIRLLAGSELVLGLGLLTGVAVLYLGQGEFVRFDHKTVFSVGTFVVIGGLLLAHARTGVRGRRAARLALLAYLLLTLAYPGVKFVTEVLIA